MIAAATAVLDLPALRSLLGYKRATDVEKCLKRQGIRYFYGRHGVWTTIDLVNAAGGIGGPSTAPAAHSLDLI